MTTREEAIQACLINSSVYPDTPFHDANWTIIRHQENQKMFAAVYQRNNRKAQRRSAISGNGGPACHYSGPQKQQSL